MSTAEAFRQALLTVQGQALEAAGYHLQSQPLQWNAGLFRFSRRDAEHLLIVDYQLLVHPEQAARYQPRLRRASGPVATSLAVATSPADAISLPRLVWDGFGVRVLPAADYWWSFADAPVLAEGLLEAGKLLVGYGLPWLDGSLRTRG